MESGPKTSWQMDGETMEKQRIDLWTWGEGKRGLGI